MCVCVCTCGPLPYSGFRISRELHDAQFCDAPVYMIPLRNNDCTPKPLCNHDEYAEGKLTQFSYNVTSTEIQNILHPFSDRSPKLLHATEVAGKMAKYFLENTA